MVNLTNSTSACSIEYVISPELYKILMTGHDPQIEKYKKRPSSLVPGLWFLRFTVIYDNNVPKITIHFWFCTHHFIDLWLMYLIVRYDYRMSAPYAQFGSFFTFIDKSLGDGKKGIIKDLVNFPDKYNEDLRKYNEDLRKGRKLSNNIISFAKKRVYVRDMDEIINILFLAFEKKNLLFISKLYNVSLEDYYLEDWMKKANFLNDFFVVVKDRDRFLQTINDRYKDKTKNLINQGIKKERGLLNSMHAFLYVLILDLWLKASEYTRYHIEKGTIPPSRWIPYKKWRFKNLKKIMGMNRWYTTKAVNNKRTQAFIYSNGKFSTKLIETKNENLPINSNKLELYVFNKSSKFKFNEVFFKLLKGDFFFFCLFLLYIVWIVVMLIILGYYHIENNFILENDIQNKLDLLINKLDKLEKYELSKNITKTESRYFKSVNNNDYIYRKNKKIDSYYPNLKKEIYIQDIGIKNKILIKNIYDDYQTTYRLYKPNNRWSILLNSLDEETESVSSSSSSNRTITPDFSNKQSSS